MLSASSWALGAILWRKLGEQLSAYSMNLGKTVLGSLFLGLALIFIGIEPVDTRSILFLALSGVVGIAIGDTFFFMALLKLGARRASLMGSLNPAAIALAAAVFLDERPSLMVWSGILATTIGVGWVLRERASGNESAHRGLTGVKAAMAVGYSSGICYGLLSVLCTAGAVLLAKVGVDSAPSAHAAWVRLTAGAAGLALWGIWRAELGNWVAPFRKGALTVKVAAVVLVVVAGGFWLSLVALKHIDASIAGPLNSTAPLFILPMAALILKEKLSFRAIVGAAVAVGGVALILTG